MVQDEIIGRYASETSSMASAAATATSQAVAAMCTVALPAGGTLVFNGTFSTYLDESITFEAPCNSSRIFGFRDNPSGNSTVVQSNDPFYSSVAPQLFALATATVISYMLVILIFITPRTFYVGGPGGGTGFLGGRTLVPGSGSTSVLSVGRRPLLQKIATLTVAIALTLATADTFSVAKEQYNSGLMDALALVTQVMDKVEIRVVRVISDTFVWLAQVQTLIRLFPRHKEKVTIKWLGFALVTCDAVFSVLENFVSKSTRVGPRSRQDGISILSYLFELSISLIYASCVCYYSLSKRRFAFWHSKMRNVFLVALLSLTSVMIPVVFFILDISNLNIATWGEYIRWVGAAAASVVVWEWVERIEALERDERKDGILGREIFDGDEMLDLTPSDRSIDKGKSSSYFGTVSKLSTSNNKEGGHGFAALHVRPRLPFPKRNVKTRVPKTKKNNSSEGASTDVATANGHISRPPQAITPISRSDTNSAASTLYAVRYHYVASPSPAIPEESLTQATEANVTTNGVLETHNEETIESVHGEDTSDTSQVEEKADPHESDHTDSRQVWQAVANPFKRRRADPPAEVAAQITESNARRSPAERYNTIRNRLHTFTAAQKRRFTGQANKNPSPPLPVTVIPAQPRTSHNAQNVDRHDSIRTPRASVIERQSEIPAVRARQSNTPVMIIPPPVRGGRTWSPDDMDNGSEPSISSSSQRSRRSRSGSQTAPPLNASQTQVYQADGNVHSIRGALTIAESPARLRDGTSSNSPAFSRRSARARGTTLDSITDRLGSASPASMAQRSAFARNTPSPGQHALSPNVSEEQSHSGRDQNSLPSSTENTT